MRKHRFTPRMLNNLGFSVVYQGYYNHCSDNSCNEVTNIVKGQFKDVIDLIFNSTDGSLDSDFIKLHNDSLPEVVKNFITNVLTVGVPTFKSAPDVDSALDLVVPRSVGSLSELNNYSSFLKDTLVNYFNPELNTNSNSVTNSISE